MCERREVIGAAKSTEGVKRFKPQEAFSAWERFSREAGTKAGVGTFHRTWHAMQRALTGFLLEGRQSI